MLMAKLICQTTETRCGHGRVETRTLTTSSLLNTFSDWPHLEQVFKLTCQTLYKKSGKSLCTLTYGITSLRSDEASPASLLHIVRTHWAIEGGSHQRRDVTFLEDHCDLRRDNSAHIMAILNNIAIALIARRSFNYAPAARRFFNAHPHQACHALVSSIP
jgi:hypothetical protein